MSKGSSETQFQGSLPIAGKLKLQFKSFDALVARLSRYISEDGIFIPTNNVKTAGTLIGLEVRVVDGETPLAVEGEVLWTRHESSEEGVKGMAIRFINISDKSRKFIEHVVTLNKAAGIEPVVKAPEQAPQPEIQNVLPTKAVKDALGSGPVLGIDFGTCNSCVAYAKDGKPSLVPGEGGSLIIPSVVAINKQGNTLIGMPAKEQLLINPENTAFSIKRFLGRNFRSPFVRENADRFPFQLKPSDKNDILVELAGKEYTLPEISSLIFAYLKEIAEGELQATLANAIVTVPAYFTENQRAAVKEAAKLGGLHVDLILNEPTAAALAYGYDQEYERRILVFDLGGGTFDVSVLEVNANVFEVKGTGGDPFLGGLDFDQRLVDHIGEFIKKKHKIDIRENTVALQRVTNAAENAKVQLSFTEETEINLPYLFEKRNKPVDLSMRIGRELLEELTKDLVEKTIRLCGNAVHSMGLMPADINDVLLVGGQTRMPLLQQRVADYFLRKPSKGVHPDEAVGLGAALLASSFSRIDGPILFDVLSLPIGFAAADGRFEIIFNRGAELPCRQNYRMDQLSIDSKSMALAIYQGEAPDAVKNEYLGDIKLVFPTLPRAPQDTDVEFEISREGILKIHAKHVPTGKVEAISMRLVDAPPVAEPSVVGAGKDDKIKEDKEGLFKKLFS